MTTSAKEAEPGTISIEYVERTTEEVMKYFVDGFRPCGWTLLQYEFFYDPHKQKVVFRLTKEKLTEGLGLIQ